MIRRYLTVLSILVIAHNMHAQVLSDPQAEPVIPAAKPATPVVGTTAAVRVSSASTTASGAKPKKFILGMKWSESARHFSVPVYNEGSKTISIYGIETSPGFFLTSLPKTIAPNSSSDVTVMYVAEAGSPSSAGFIKVLTSTGVKTIAVDHGREAVVQFDSNVLTWTQGGAASAKTVTITVLPNTTVPIAVQTMGDGTVAKLSSVGGGKYLVTVTPGSTKDVTRFPVTVIFSPAPPGVVGSIQCEVSP